jgi:prepilin-type N-terminal cleavage/methylation domain-containing protein
MTREPSPFPGRRAPRAAGFTLIEVCAALVILVIAILGHVASVGAAHQSAQSVEERGLALQTLERFTERLRDDPDWETLWVRLRARSVETTTDTALASLTNDFALPTVAATTYYSDFQVPSQLQNASFLVQVPAVDNAGVWELRENLNAPRYGLPWDLNGDGLTDATPRNDDYRQLPVVVRIRWGGAGRMPTEITLSTWLRGDR